MAGARLVACLRITTPALLLGGLLGFPAGALAEAPTERLSPSPAPIVALPRLTPSQAVSPPLTPGVVWEHPPEAPPPLSPPNPQSAPVRSATIPPPAVSPVSAAAPKPPDAGLPPSPTIKAPPIPPTKPQDEAVAQPIAKESATKEPGAKEPVAQDVAAPQPPAAPVRRTMTATAGIYLRATPDAKGRVLDTVEKGEQVTAFGAPANGWQRVGRAGKPQGYVTSAYLAEAAPARSASADPASAMPKAPPKPGRYAKADPEDRGCALPGDLPGRMKRPQLSGGTVVKLRAAGNLRVAPVCDAKVLDVLEAGERVTVLEAIGGWYRVGRKGKTLGYVGAALLTPVAR
ncbi:hypothetical protein TSH100_28460 [Azospirillum sp. TSH100]|uniref:SH3 domain-containing protein n=1 Tax=Azospirillum sp. TSH100 TaxID=652764 RepID=UPI000D61DFEE|nr:SH3 domain-containing protein [Azospirillum sp. TSH100]PWC80988.1 hypothetical protein TSH100_28460 [Azospirillum sp. TSH100]QCG87219.1 SH3 domain-containing protein [Azospirillum sp. TSH100]